MIALVCGLEDLAYLVIRPRSPVPPLGAGEPDTRHVERDLPPGPPG